MTKDETLKLALEALENLFGIPDKWTGEGGGDVAVWRLGGSYRAQEAIKAIKAALEAKDEPVAWANRHDLQNFDMKVRTNGDPLHTIPLYTTPPQRKPLTDEEIGAILEGVNAYGTRLYTFARAVEAAHGIKGEA